VNQMSVNVNINELVCGSALQLAEEASPTGVKELRHWPGEPPIFVCRTEDVLYLPSALGIGQSLQMIAGRVVPVEAILDPFTLGFVQQRRASKNITKYDEPFEVQYFDGDVCILGNVFSRNFTHWHEELLKVQMLALAGVECDFVFSRLPVFATEALQLLGVPTARIHDIDEPTVFRSAYYMTPISYENVWRYPGVLLKLREALLAAAESDAPSYGPRLWLDRGQQTRLGRKLVNAEEVYRCLEEYGFERLDMGALPMNRQIAVAQRMQAMAGLHGSQFVHSQLMPRRSLVIECFSPHYMNPTYTSIYHALGHRYCQVTSTNTPAFPYQHDGDVEVDCLQLRVALKEVCSRVSSASG
jgi:capsular polysaccharide biosynthesis protein